MARRWLRSCILVSELELVVVGGLIQVEDGSEDCIGDERIFKGGTRKVFI